nr:hypothetical protein [uncultured Pseudomonas sp.]
MADQTQRLEIATVKAEVGSNILYLFANAAETAGLIETESGEIKNLKQIIADLQEDAAEKISVATTIFPTAAAGLAATADGGIFLVQSAEADEIYSVWKNEAGAAVNTGKTAMSSQAIEDALTASNEAAQAAEAAADIVTTRTAGFLQPTPETPVTRDDGLPLQVGDRYFNTTDQAEFIYKTDGWVANDSLEAIAGLEDRTDPQKGAAIVGFDETTVHEQLIAARKVANYSAARSYNGPAKVVQVTQSGISGNFSIRPFAAGDIDDGGTVLVSADGQRTLERDRSGPDKVSWFGVKGDGSDETANLQKACNSSFSIEFGKGAYKFSGLTVRQGTRMFGSSRTDTILQVIGSGITIVDGGIKRDSSITDMSITPMAAGLPSAIYTNFSDFFALNGVEISRVNIKGPDTDASGYGLRTPNYYFTKNIHTKNSNKCNIVDVTIVGGYKIEVDPATQAESWGLFTEGTSIGITLSNFNVKCVQTPWEFGDNVEGFWINNSEWVYNRRGVFGNTTVSKPGGWITGLHINCALEGINLNLRNAFYITGTSIFRASFYFPEATWDGIKLRNCQRYSLDNNTMRPDFTGHLGVKKGYNIVGGIGGSLGAGCTSYMTEGVHIEGNTGFKVGSEAYFESCSTNVNIAADCVSVDVRKYGYNSPSRLLNNLSQTTRIVKGGGYESVDSSIRAIAAAGSETFQQGITKRHIRLRLDAGASLYTYNVILSNAGCQEGDDFEVSVRLAATNPTLTITADAAVIQTIAPTSAVVSYYLKFKFTGSVWRCVAACQSLHT